MSKKISKVMTILMILALSLTVVATTLAAPASQDSKATPTAEATGTITKTTTTTETAKTTATTETVKAVAPTTETVKATTTTTETAKATAPTTETVKATAPTTETVKATAPTTETVKATATTTETAKATAPTTETVKATATVTTTAQTTETVKATATTTATIVAKAPTSAAVTVSTICEQNYVVQSGDLLTKIAHKVYSNSVYYTVIYSVTAEVAKTNPTYTKLTSPDTLNVGWTLCLPSEANADAILSGKTDAATLVAKGGTTVVAAPATATTATTTTATPVSTATTATTATATTATTTTAVSKPAVNIPQGKGAFSFENLSTAELIVDVIGPDVPTLVIPPTGKNVFILTPGSYKFNAHSPGGGVTLPGGTFDLATGQLVTAVAYQSSYKLEVSAPAVQATAPATTAPVTTTMVTTTTAATTTTVQPTAVVTPTAQPVAPVTATTTSTTTNTPATTATIKAPAGTAGLAPLPGRSRIYLQNLFAQEVTFDLNGKTVKVSANGLEFVDVDPGKYKFTVSIPGGAGNGEVEVGADQSFLVRVNETGGVGWGKVYP